MDIAADLGSEAKRHSQHVGKSAISGVRDFGTEFIKQLFGGGNSVPANVSDDQLAQMDSNDKAFSDAAYLDTRARIMAIYEEYRMKRLKEEEERREKERLESQQKMARLRGETIVQKQQKQQDIANAMGKASAETGRSYGAE